MTPTNEQIIAEAERRWLEEYKANGGRIAPGSSKELHVINIMREGWMPPEPVDPDILAFREWAAARFPADAEAIRKGLYDDQAAGFLAGARMAREQEQERERAQSAAPFREAEIKAQFLWEPKCGEP